MKFSANLGMLWTDLSLTDAVVAAHAAGFDAVECHWPYDTPADELRRVLKETGLPLLSLNTSRGNLAAGEFGLSALPGREAEAQAALDEAIAYAATARAAFIHVMAGRSEGEEAGRTFESNLAYACAKAWKYGIRILIEPLNAADAPGYYLRTTAQAAEIIDATAHPALGLMFDCYHVARTEGDVLARLRHVLPHVGHIQFASVPERGPPDRGDVDYSVLLPDIAALGWAAPFGAEYRPDGPTGSTLGWLTRFRTLS